MYSLNRKLILVTLALLSPVSAFAGDVSLSAVDFGIVRVLSNGSSMTNFTIDAASEVAGNVMQCPEATTITTIGYRYGARVAGTPCAHQVSIQGVDLATGGNDGTIKSSGNAKAVFTPPADTSIDGLIQEKTLTASYTCTRGELLSFVIGDDTTDGCTPSGANASSFGYTFGSLFPTHVPYIFTTPGGSLSKSNGHGSIYFKSASKTYGRQVVSYGAQQFGDDSTFDEYGNVFPVSAFSTSPVTIVGVRLRQQNSANKSVTYRLVCGATIGAAGSTIADGTFDTDAMQVTGSAGGAEYLFTTTSISAVAPTDYCRITMRCNSTGGASCGLQALTVNANADLNSWSPGISVYGTKRANDGASWTDEDAKRYAIEPIVAEYTAASGSSGPKQNQPGSGGMQ